MPVGNQLTRAQFDQFLTSCVTQLGGLYWAIEKMNRLINGQAGVPGLTVLENLGGTVGAGYGSTAVATNPGGVSDAQCALNMLANLMEIAGAVDGTLFIGSTATNGVQENYLETFAPISAGQ